MISHRSLAIALALCTVTTASYALGTAEQRAACTPDVFRLCSSEIPNVSGIIACMKAKKSSLSAACRAVFDDKVPTKTASEK
jgi:hypothetical protein